MIRDVAPESGVRGGSTVPKGPGLRLTDEPTVGVAVMPVSWQIKDMRSCIGPDNGVIFAVLPCFMFGFEDEKVPLGLSQGWR